MEFTSYTFMSITETLNKIKALFSSLPEPEIKLSQYKLMDGTEVEISSLEVGGIVTINGMPAPAGIHSLEDGTTIEVDDSGTIVNINSQDNTQNSEMVMSEQQIQEKFNEMFSAKQEDINKIVEAKYSTQIQEMSETIAKQKEAIEQLLSLVDKISKTSASDPVEPPKQEFSKEIPKNGVAAKYFKYANIVKNMKDRTQI